MIEAGFYQPSINAIKRYKAYSVGSFIECLESSNKGLVFKRAEICTLFLSADTFSKGVYYDKRKTCILWQTLKRGL